MDPQGHRQHRRLRQVLERPDDCRVRKRNLAGEAVSSRVASPVAVSPLAGKPAPTAILVDVSRLEQAYYERKPDLEDPSQLVSFGTSGHRGSPLRGTFTEAHIAAIAQAICD